jgi:hypothetical protein
MRNTMVRGLVVLTAGLLGTAAPAQAPLRIFPGQSPLPVSDLPPQPVKSQAVLAPEAARPPAGVGRIEVYNGPWRTVHYVPGSDASPGERSALNDLARTENEEAYAGDLLALKREYVESERQLEPYRRFLQQQLYGYSTSSTYSAFVGGGGSFGVPYGGDYAYGTGWGPSFGGGAETTVSKGLAGNGLGYEGPLKEAMARQIAAEANPEYAATAARARDLALGRVASSERLAKGFGLDRSAITPAAATTPSRIVLTLKSGEKLEGTLYGEDAEWFRVDTATGTVSVRKGDVTRVEVPKK